MVGSAQAHEGVTIQIQSQSETLQLDCNLSDFSLQPKSEDENVDEVATLVAELRESVPPEFLAQISYCVGDSEMYSWTNVPGRRSGGIRMGDLSEAGQKRVWETLQALLSPEGYSKIELLATDIELASGAGTIDDYTVAIFGNPREDSAWGFQFDGHHVALNFLVHGDNLTLAPMFVGAQPLTVAETTPLKNEMQLGRELFKSLPEEQQVAATVEGLVRRDVFVGTGAGHADQNRDFDFSQFDGVGLSLEALNDENLNLVKSLVREYLGYLASPFAEQVWAKVEDKLSNGFYAYSQLQNRVYYRIYVPNVILVEYNDVASDHLHTVTRLLDHDGLSDYGIFARSNLGSQVTDRVFR